MKKYLTTSLGRLRLIAILEGITLLCMVFITVPLRVYYGVNTFSKILGPVHGCLFLLFIFNTLRFAVENNWKFKQTTWKVLIACIIPFGTFYIDCKILRPLETAENKSE
jgi:integral membrane protein